VTASWLTLIAGTAGDKYFLLSYASMSALSYQHNLSQPVIRLWNDDHDVFELAPGQWPLA
jgi:probable phosphoglycerate mutase